MTVDGSAQFAPGPAGQFPAVRLRRMRSHPQLRRLVRETELNPGDFIQPLFVRHGTGPKLPIPSMPGQFQLTVESLLDEVRELESLGIPGIILFGIPAQKDSQGSDSWSDTGIIQQAVRALRQQGTQLLIISDVCFCEFTDHGHCGVIHDSRLGKDVDNDATLELLVRQGVSHAQAGVDMIAPSGMMDGMIGALRRGLDQSGFTSLPIMSYAAKYCSAFYGPFREAAESAPQFGDRRTYQMDPANGTESLRETSLDLAEGADVLMVKPALSYLDVIRRVRDTHPGVPLAAYNVSGEYAMVKAAAAQGWIDERRITLEILTSIKRAGADMILTYHARDAVRWLDSLSG